MKNTVVIFSICIEHNSKARNKDFGFTSARLFLPLLDQLLTITTISCSFLQNHLCLTRITKFFTRKRNIAITLLQAKSKKAKLMCLIPLRNNFAFWRAGL